jgi:hypothetical protein
VPNIGRRLCVVYVVNWTYLNTLSGQYVLNMRYSTYLFAVGVVIAVLLAYYDLHRLHLHHYSRIESCDIHECAQLIAHNLVSSVL